MGNFEKLSVLVIVVIIVMILVVALYTWTDNPADSGGTATASTESLVGDPVVPDAVSSSTGKGSGGASLPWPIAEPTTKIKKESPVEAPSPAAEKPAPETPTPPPAVETKEEGTLTPAAERIYEVKEGDTYGSIAKELLGSASKWKAIQDANPGIEPERLQKGMKLKIPALGGTATIAKGGETGNGKSEPSGSAKPGSSYRVQSGDTLEKISKKVYGTTSRWPEIWVANLAKLDSPDDVRKDMDLLLPR